MARLGLAIAGVVVAACGPASVPVATPTGPAAGRLAVDAPRTVALTCELDGELRHGCTASIPITITSAYAGPVFVERLRHDDVTGALSVASPRPVLVEPGAFALPMWSHREHTIAVVIRVRAAIERDGQLEAGDVLDQVEAPPIVVTNPARDAARRACRACEGDWQTYGPAPEHPLPGADLGETCNCRTNDAGRACRDEADCEGWCNATGFTVVQTYANQSYGYVSGECSDHVHMTHCGAPIQRGARNQPLVPKPDGIIDPGSMCVDYAMSSDYLVNVPVDDDGLD